MTDLFSYDDLGILTQSLGRAPDDALLAQLIDTARDMASAEYAAQLRRYPSVIEAHRERLAQYERDFAAWSEAAQDYDRQSRRYEGALQTWLSVVNKEDMPAPVKPVHPGPMPEAPETPPEPVPPTDADAVAMLMDEQRKAVARMANETTSETSIALEIERAEIVNEAFDLVMRKLSVQVTPEPEPDAPLLPAPDALMSDYGPVGMDDITGDLLLDAFEENEVETAAIVQTLSALRLKHLSEQLNVERARLDREHQATGVANPRSASIDRLLGLLTRRGEV